jgi:hypothetical protein
MLVFENKGQSPPPMSCRQKRLFLLGYSLKIGCFKGTPDYLGGDRCGDNGIDELGGLDSI